MLKGRLGLETARVPYLDRHGLMWIERGKLYVEDGVLVFATAGGGGLAAGAYQIPFQNISVIFMGPGCTISHDSLRLLARHGTGLVVTGSGGVRHYASMPFGPDRSGLARKQVALWADPESRMAVARSMFALRLEDDVQAADIQTPRGIEGVRMKEMYKRLARQYGVSWNRRQYDRARPQAADPANVAINHASAAVRAAAMIAVAATATVPQLGFIHEASGQAFALDIADLHRTSFTLPVAFRAVRRLQEGPNEDLERLTRSLAGRELRHRKIIPAMIDNIKEVLHADNDSSDA